MSPFRTMDGFSRPATLDDVKLLLSALNERAIPYFLIGGYALAAHGYQRATTDIDLLLPATFEAGVRVKSALMALPDGAARELLPEWFAEGDTIRVADAFVVDLMFTACGETYESLLPYAETIELDGIPVHTINLEGLLLTKRTVRDKDVSDRLVLERAIAAIAAMRAAKR